MQGDKPLQTASRCQLPSGVDEIGGQVDAGDLAADSGGHCARRSARAAADIQKPAVRSDIQPVAEPVGRLHAADMELIIGGKQFRCQTLAIMSGFGKCPVDPRNQLASGIMLFDGVARCHLHGPLYERLL